MIESSSKRTPVRTSQDIPAGAGKVYLQSDVGIKSSDTAGGPVAPARYESARKGGK